jgi:hypothetical protein
MSPFFGEITMKKLAGLALAATLTASTAFAGGVAEPVMEPEVVAAATSSSAAGVIVPLLLLLVVAAALSASSNPVD